MEEINRGLKVAKTFDLKYDIIRIRNCRIYVKELEKQK
jgi:hypothetical protein